MIINKKYATHKREPFFDVVAEYIHPNSKVLDIGSGNAAFAKYFGRNDFYLFDGNKKTVEELKKEYNNVILGDLPILPYDDNFFEVIHCSHVVEHLQPQEFYDTLKEIDRCLKIGGYLVISTPLYWSGFYNDLSHVRPYNPKVYLNYLCGNQPFSRTRKVISENYNQVKLLYRYKEATSEINYTLKNTNLLIKIASKILNMVLRKGMIFYEKTGYTIVLKKS